MDKLSGQEFDSPHLHQYMKRTIFVITVIVRFLLSILMQ